MLRPLGTSRARRALCSLLPLAALAPSVGAQEPAYDPPVAEASDEARAALAGFEAQAGIELELWAAEPLVANPVCLWVAHGGDVYVAETFRHHAGVTDIREHMDWLDDDLAAQSVEDRAAYFERHTGEDYARYGEEHERIRLLRDTDGDGMADEALVFADGFNDPMAGIGAGLLEHDGAVYYACIPDLWRLVDTDGDGRANQREKLSTGYGVNVALLGHDLHGLRIGPDGRLYFSCGDRGFRVVTESGVLAHHHTGAVLRCELDGSKLEVFATGLRNPQELVFDEFGNLWTGDNNSDGGDEARWVYVVEGMDAGWRYGYQWITEPNLRGPWNDERLWHPAHEGQAAYVLPPVANLAQGPAGLAYYPGTGLADHYAGHFFLCDFRGDPSYSGIHTFTVEPRGAGFALGPVAWFVKNTLVTDADFGPDGRLWFTDWVFGWNKTGKGRIYRAFDPATIDSELVRETRALLADGVAQLELDALEDLLAHADQRVRLAAQLELAARAEGEPPVEMRLAAVLFDRQRPRLARLHALWGLDIVHRRRPPSRELVADFDTGQLLVDPDPEVRAQTCRALADSDAAPAVIEAIDAGLGDDEPRVRAFAALALGRRRERAALPGLWDLLAQSADDPVLRHAAIVGLTGTATVQELGAARSHPASIVRLGAVVALRRKHGLGAFATEELVGFLADGDPLVRLEAARAIYDEGLEAGYGALAALTGGAESLDGDALPYATGRRALNAHFRLGQRANAEALAALARRSDLDERLRVEALDRLAQWREPPGRDGVTGAWRPLPAREADWLARVVTELATDAPASGAAAIDSAPIRVLKRWIALAMQVAPDQNVLRLADWALERERSAAVRAACLRALRDSDSPAVLERLRTAFFDADPDVRAAALVALRRVAPSELLPLVRTALGTGAVAERRAAYETLAELDDPGARDLLALAVEDLARDMLPQELALDVVLAAERLQDPAVDALLAIRARGRGDESGLEPWLDSLWGGDPERGERLFREDAVLACLRCHRIDPPPRELASDPDAGLEGGLEGAVGPALVGVGRRLTRLDLALSIVAPNRRIAAGYETESFFFVDGGHVAGRVLLETADEIAVLDADGSAHSFAPDAVELRRPALSAMPTNLADTLTRAELRDLVAFLASL